MKPILFSAILFSSLITSTIAIAAETGDTDTAAETDTDTGNNPDSKRPKDDSSSDTDTVADTDPSGSSNTGEETVMDFPMEIDDNPYTGKKAPPPKPKAVEKPAQIPVVKEEANPPWAETPPQDTSSENESDEPEEGVTYLPPPPPPPSEVSDGSEIDTPCAVVTCSARGTCVLKNNEPTCACFQGFVPDSVNGLSCIPETPATPVRPTWDMDTYYTNMSIALGDYQIRPKLHEYRDKASRGEIKGSFAEYLGQSFKRTQNFGTIAMSFGIAAFAGGLSMHMLYAGYPNKGGLLAGAILLDITGIGLISTGAVLMALASKRSKKLKKFEKSARRNLARVMLLPPQIQAGQDSARLSLGVIFF